MEIEEFVNEVVNVNGVGESTQKRILEYFLDKKEIENKRDSVNPNQNVNNIENIINSVYCGDNITLTRKLIPDNSIDLTITSPPYDKLRDYERNWDFNYKKLAHELYRVTKDGGIIVWIVADETKDFCETLSSFKQAIYFSEICGFKLLDTMIYRKKNYAPAYPSLQRYVNVFEYMFVFLKGRKPNTFNKLKVDKDSSNISGSSYSSFRQKNGDLKRKKVNKGNRKKSKTNVWTYTTGNSGVEDSMKFKHPATFPNKLARDHIKTWSNEGDIIFDPMCGSGTTLKEAYSHNRNYIGIDISNKYCDLSRKRIKQATKKTSFENDLSSKNSNNNNLW